MNSFQARHADEGVLLRLLDGELPGGEARQVQRHLEACWQCRAGVEELEDVVADCVRYRKHVLGEMLPPPPEPWRDLYREFDRIDASLAAQSWFSRSAEWLRTPNALRWAVSTVAAAALAIGLFLQFRETPSVQAAALLKRAVAAAQAHPAAPHRIRIRTSNLAPVIRVAGGATKAEPISPALFNLFQTARWDWQDPLSAKAYSAWRDLLADKKDEVASGADSYRIRTVTPQGELAAASLTMRATDLHPIEGKLEFRNQDWIEFAEVSDATTLDDGSTVAAHVEPPPRRAEPSQPAASASIPEPSISDELRVIAALHGIGADLGDPVEISRSGGQLVIGGVGIPPSRQRQIRAALDHLPNVTVQFAEPAAPPTAAEPASGSPSPVTGPPVAPAIQTRLERHLGGHPEFLKFSSKVLDWNEAATSRAYALRRLAERFTAEKESAMSADDRRLLKQLSREHTAALASTVAELDRAVAPVLAAMGGSPAQGQPAANASRWQNAAEDVLQSSRRVELLMSELLGATPSAGPTDRLPSDLLAAIAKLRANIDNCRRLLAAE